MKFKKYYLSLSANEKAELAKGLNTSVVYLSQLAHGHRNPGVKKLLSIEKASKGNVTMQEFSGVA